MDGETAGQEGGVTVNDSTSGAAGEPSGLSRKSQSGLLAQYLPILEWGRTYNGSVLTNDLVAAIIVTIMLIPPSLAYALLAGLPPVVDRKSVGLGKRVPVRLAPGGRSIINKSTLITAIQKK